MWPKQNNQTKESDEKYYQSDNDDNQSVEDNNKSHQEDEMEMKQTPEFFKTVLLDDYRKDPVRLSVLNRTV